MQMHVHDTATGRYVSSMSPWPVRGAGRAQRVANRLYRDSPSNMSVRFKVTIDGKLTWNTGKMPRSAADRAVGLLLGGIVAVYGLLFVAAVVATAIREVAG